MITTPKLLRKPYINDYPTYPAIGVFGAAIGALLAYVTMPDRVAQPGALRVPATLLSAGLLAGPLVAAVSRPIAIFRIENTAVGGLVYWLLLDLIQGVYELEGVGRESVGLAFLAIGLFASCFWVGTYSGRLVRLPRMIWDVAAQDNSQSTLFAIILTAFGLAFLRFAIPSGFDPMIMIQGLTKSRFAAPWSRGGSGGWDAFLDHLAYFGYLLPCLTVMLAHKLGAGATGG